MEKENAPAKLRNFNAEKYKKKPSLVTFKAPEVETPSIEEEQKESTSKELLNQAKNIQNEQVVTSDKATAVETPKQEEESRGEESKGHKANVGRPSKIESLVKENIHVEGNHYYLSTHLNKQAADRLKYTVESLAAVDKDISNKVLVHIAINYLYDTFKTDLVKFKRQIDEARNSSL